MALQTRNLVMVGMGVKDDNPPNLIQPKLPDGIHLRWAFKREHGFPWHGYYLFRRLHSSGNPLCLSQAIPPLGVGKWHSNILSTPRGVISSEKNLHFTDDFQPHGVVEFNLSESRLFYYRVPTHDHPARRIDLKIGFRANARLEVTALFEDETRFHPCVNQWVSGRAGEVVTVTLEFDALSCVHIASGPIALIDVCYVPVSQDASVGWGIVPGFPYPLRLPIAHPDYPCTANQSEDLAASLALARSRVLYDDPEMFTPLPPVPVFETGKISVKKGSAIVTGSNSNWGDEVMGSALQVSGDNTAYTIVKVVAPNKLVLSRDYTGASQVDANYVIREDPFAQLHDQLATLVAGGPNPPSGPMADRSLPDVIHSKGVATVEGGSSTVTGTGTHWTEQLRGLGFQALGDNSGTVSVKENSEFVTGAGTNWDGDLVGMTVRLAGDLSEYTIVKVTSTTQFTLDRGYEGSDGSGKSYTTCQKAIYSIKHIDSPTQLKLHRPYLGPKKPKKTDYQIIATLQSETDDSSAPRMSKQYPLDLVLLGSLHPALAQIVGLYWVDQHAEPDVAYDYLIMTGRPDLLAAGEDPESLLNLIQGCFESRFADMDGFIVFNKKVEKAAQLPSPSDLRAYALPGAFIPQPNGSSMDAQNNVGLKWDLGVQDGVLLPAKPVMYHLWRTEKLDEEPVAPLPTAQHKLLTRDRPVIVPRMSSKAAPQRPPDWPPFRMHAIDRGLKEGWYGYQVSGIDIFGRHSPNSDPAQWHQWTPEPDPTPWYYKHTPADSQVHAFAIRLLDKGPPPPPAGIEAYALDPDDPTVFQDDAYKDWRIQNPGAVGVQISWLWTPAHMHQAPDIREFRIYFQPGRANALLGQTVSVKNISETECEVGTDIPNTQPAGKYIGATLRFGSASFKVTGSEATDPLKVRVNSGPFYDQGTIEVQSGSVIVKGKNTSWKKNLIGSTLQVKDEQTAYTILDVDEKTQPQISQKLKLDRPYHGMADNKPQTYTIKGKKPVTDKDCTLVIPSPCRAGTVTVKKGSGVALGKETGWSQELIGRGLQIAGEAPKYTIVKVNSNEKLQLNPSYQGNCGGWKAYVITHPLFVDYGSPSNWEKRLQVVGYDENVTETIRPVQSEDGRYLRGSEATVAGKVVQLGSTPENKPDLSGIPANEETPFPAFLLLEKDTGRPSKRYRIVGVNNITKTVTLDAEPNTGGVASAWAIGLPVRKYEVFLTLPTEKFDPTLADPIVYAQIGVSAADDKGHTPDHAKWGGDPNRYGNEGRMGAPVKISRVWSKQPPAPVPPPDSDKVWATAADYQGHSYYTYRWKKPAKGLKAHIFRALDDTLFKVDWAKRSENKMFLLDPGNPKHLKFFPPDWNANKHQPVADELKSFMLTGAAAKIAGDVVTLDGAPDLTKVKASRNFVWLKEDTAHPAKCYSIVAVDTNSCTVKVDGKPKLSGNTSKWAIPLYDSLSNDALRVLAGLPDNDRAFTQITIQPLDPEDPKTANARGPGDPDDFKVWDPKNPPAQPKNPLEDPNLRIYTDTLDGRSTNRYFYRSQYVDNVHNRSEELSLASPPIWLPNVVPPRAPVITKVSGGDREIALKWASNREQDLKEYRVYSTQDEETARDIRLMGLPIHKEPVQPGDPVARPAEISWTDKPVKGHLTCYYRILAVDDAENVSESSRPVSARAFDHSPPVPPTWQEAKWVKLDDKGNPQSWEKKIKSYIIAVKLHWSLKEPGLKCLVQRRLKNEKFWIPVSQWLRSEQESKTDSSWSWVYYDELVRPTDSYQYRIQVINAGGQTSYSTAMTAQKG